MTIRKLMGIDIHINEKIPVVFSMDDVRITQLDYADALLYCRFPAEVYKTLKTIQIDGSEAHLDHWKIEGKGMYVGNWTKRFLKYVKVTYKIKLNPANMSILGEQLARIANSVSGEELYLDFTDHADWRAGTFGESESSCWWPGGSYNSSRIKLIKEGGGAVRVFTADQNPRARAWYFPVSGDNIALFNVYDKQAKLTLLSLSNLLSMKFGVRYRRNGSVFIPGAYINGKSVYVLGIDPPSRPITLGFSLSEVPPIQDGLFDGMDGRIGARIRCTICASPNASNYYDQNDNAYPLCIEHLRTTCCKHCGNDLSVEDGFYYRGLGLYCESCNDEYIASCSDCGENVDVDDDDNIYINENLVCGSCKEDHYTFCEDCDHYVNSENTQWVERCDRTVCNSCFDESYFVCGICGNPDHNDDKRQDYKDNDICESCTHDMEKCEECEKWMEGDEALAYYDEVGREFCICPSCAESSEFTVCEECHCYFRTEDNHNHEDPRRTNETNT